MDWNNDGQLDLVTGEQDGHVRVYLNSASGLTAFSYVQVSGANYVAAGNFAKPDVVDWNNDGKKDLVVGDGNGDMHLLLNTGTDASPVFATATTLKAKGTTTNLSVGSSGRASPVVLDWDHDGKKDLLVGETYGKILYFQNVGTDAAPQFSQNPIALSVGGTQISVGYYARPEVSDWDNDGILDILCGNGNGQVYYFHVNPPPPPPPTISISDASVTEGDGGTKVLSFAVTLSAAPVEPVSVRYVTDDWTATLATGDYQEAKGTLAIAAGQQTVSIDVVIYGDTVVEEDEKFYLTLWQPTGVVLGRAQAVGTILNDDLPVVSIQNVSQAEGNSGNTDFRFTVNLSQAIGQPVDVQYTTNDGTATTAGGDYTAASGTVTIAAGKTSATIVVPVTGDTVVEPDKAFSVNLLGATKATIGTGTATGTILNDDVLTMSINDVSQAEGNSGTTDYAFTVSLSQAAIQPVTVQYATVDGAAKAGSDYTAASGTLTIPIGQSSAPVVVSINGDTDSETDESFLVRLSGAANAAIAKNDGVGTIRNDDALPALSSSSVLENQAAGAAVGTLSTMDPDAGDTFTYTLESGDVAAFTITGDTLKTAAAFDYEAKNSYSILIRSTDQGGLWTEKDFTISVTNVNENPTDMSLSSGSVLENQAAGTAVGTLSTVDPDAGDTFTYTLVSGDVGAFTITGDTLKTAAAFDCEAKNSYSIGIRSTDQWGLWTEKTFTISVTDVNEAPTDITLAPSSAPGNQAAGTTVGTLNTIDPDAANTFTYNLVGGAGGDDNASFTIVGNTLTTNAVFHYETKNTYSARVRSTDQGGLWTEKAFTVNVTDMPPTVTIEQAVGQVDPTNGSPVQFTVVFSKAVTGFTTGDVTLAGTAGATTATVTGSGTTYNVAVSGMTQSGTVIASVPAGVASDAASNTNAASTSTDNTVTVDCVAPQAWLTGAAIASPPKQPYWFKVTYKDDTALKASTVGAGDIVVYPPKSVKKYKPVATWLPSKKPFGNTKSIVTYYSIPAPGGTWDKADNGVYSVVLVYKHISDLVGNAIAPKKAGLTLGTFKVQIGAKSAKVAQAKASASPWSAATARPVQKQDRDSLLATLFCSQPVL